MDKTEDDVMAQKPRPSGSPIITASIWLDIIVFGFVMAIFGLIAIDMSLPGGLIPTSFADFINGNAPLAHDLDAARSMCFTVLVFTEMIYALGSRSNTRSIFSDFASNRMLLGAIGISVIMQVLVIQVPFLNSAFSTTGLTIWQWLICVLFSIFILGFSEAKKWLIRRRNV
jgi:magnesium-transporting ATPase (P-type)